MRSSWFVFLVIPFLLSLALAQDPIQKSSSTYRMTSAVLYKTNETLLIIANGAFKSVSDVKDFVTTLPPGSTLEWAPGCRSIKGQLLSTKEELLDLSKFCSKRKVKFVQIPAG